MGKQSISRRLHRLELLVCFNLRGAGDKLIPPNQMHALDFIRTHPGCAQAEVADELHVSAASVAQSLKRMEAAGFIERRAHRNDMRSNCLHITDKGAAAAEKCREVFDSINERIVNGFSEAETAKLNEFLERMVHNLESSATGGMNNMELSKLVMLKPHETGENTDK